jgi:hypothetical protein
MRYWLPLLILGALSIGAPVLAGPDENPEREKEEREFRRRVDRAITDGAAFLSARQREDGSWQHTYDEHFPGGVTALCLLAVLESEVSVWSDTVTKGVAALRRAKLNRVYSAALGIMAMESYRVPPEERKAHREGKEVKRILRKLTKEEKAWIRKHVDLIVNGRQRDAWGYPGPPPPNTQGEWGGDLSNTQYALLGLKSAARCRIRVDEDVWMRILRIVLGAQEKDGPRVKLVVDREVTKDGYGRSYARPAEARGWRYRWAYTVKAGNSTQTFPVAPDDKPSGSMTCAGISCLAIIHSEMHRSRRYRSKMRDVQRAIDDGFAWLDRNWTVEENPGGKRVWHYYYLYGLERAGMLANRKWIGLHDWYREGAEFLLARQGPSGSWGDVVQTSFALLFLKRSTMPVTLTGLR